MLWGEHNFEWHKSPYVIAVFRWYCRFVYIFIYKLRSQSILNALLCKEGELVDFGKDFVRGSGAKFTYENIVTYDRFDLFISHISFMELIVVG